MRLKAVYTIEAAVVISLCFLLFGSAVMVTFNLYKETSADVAVASEEYNAVEAFRRVSSLKNIKEEIFTKEE